MLHHFISDSEEQRVLTDAIDSLEMTHHDAMWMALEAGSGDVEPVAIVPPEYVDLLRRKSAAALIVLGEFAEVFRIVKERWFLAG
jgi:hypothetical protein